MMSIPARLAAGRILADFVRAIVEFLDNELNLFEDIRLFINSMEDLFRLRIPMLFLKQIRDVVHPLTSGLSGDRRNDAFLVSSAPRTLSWRKL